MTDDIITDPEQIRSIKEQQQSSGPGNVGARTRALLDGNIVHLKGRTAYGTPPVMITRAGMRLRSTKDGSGGAYVWAEKKEQEA